MREIVLAPLAGGPSTPELTAAVSAAGGFGFLAAGYLDAAELEARLKRVRSLTGEPFGVNLFYLEERPVDAGALARYARELAPEAARQGVELGEARFDDDGFEEKLELVLRSGASVVSFTFGCPAADVVDRIHRASAEVWVTVTSAAEALEAADADALVVQGVEAGGHRGGWRDDEQLPLVELLARVRAVADRPLVASGGIGTRDDVERALAAGASAVQVGSAFLLCPEAATSRAHRAALARDGETELTRAFTGKDARGIVNRFMRAHPDAPKAYPHVHHLTAPLRAAARAAGDAESINLWAGVGYRSARELPAAEIVASLTPRGTRAPAH